MVSRKKETNGNKKNRRVISQQTGIIKKECDRDLISPIHCSPLDLAVSVAPPIAAHPGPNPSGLGQQMVHEECIAIPRMVVEVVHTGSSADSYSLVAHAAHSEAVEKISASP